MTDMLDDLGEIFGDEDETEVYPDLGTIPSVKVLMTGRPEIYVGLHPDQDNTVGQILDEAQLVIRPGSATEVYVDGVLAGMDTVVQAGQTIVPIGLVKGGQ